jgi:hypothetical protein
VALKIMHKKRKSCFISYVETRGNAEFTKIENSMYQLWDWAGREKEGISKRTQSYRSEG